MKTALAILTRLIAPLLCVAGVFLVIDSSLRPAPNGTGHPHNDCAILVPLLATAA